MHERQTSKWHRGRMYRRYIAVVVFCLCSMGSVGGSASQQEYPAAKPGDSGYVAEDPQLARQTSAMGWLGIVAHLWTTPNALTAYQARMKPRVPMALDSDGRLFRIFGIQRLPAVALIGADGRLVRMVGPDDTDLAAAVKDLVAPH